jgi:outer membrane protein OmpA-like peptidoglycan-associated protein
VKRFFVVYFFIISSAANAFQMKREAYIDIPSANFEQGLYVSADFSYPIRNVDYVKFDPNVGIDFSYNNFGIGLKWYDGVDFALDLSYRISEESGNFPALAIGISELSNRKYISTAGFENVFMDEDYPDRPPEIASAYFVGTKKLTYNFEMTAGIGRGKFVGYGPVSKSLNIDAFSDEKHGNWAFGIFGGVKIDLSPNIFFIAETDGRDANVGWGYQNESIKANLVLGKIEHIADRLELSSRIGLNFSYKIMEPSQSKLEKEKSHVVIGLLDKESGVPVNGRTVTVDRKGDTIKALNLKSSHSFMLEPGIYAVSISADGYEEKKFALTVRGGTDRNLFVVEWSKLDKNGKTIKSESSVKRKDDLGDIEDVKDNMSITYPFKEDYFDLGALSTLKKIIDIMSGNENIRLLIAGHSWREGNDKENLSLSEKRAEKVKEYLVDRGVPADKITAKGYGEKKPAADSSTEEGRRENRRVEFIFYRMKK